jgi:peroxiredoxin
MPPSVWWDESTASSHLTLLAVRDIGPQPHSPKGRSHVRTGLTPGDRFPDYELTDHTHALRRLSELQGPDPMILTLARGGYCPREHQHHLELAGFFPKVAVAYTRIVTITPDTPRGARAFHDAVGAQWPFLADPTRIVQRDLDIPEYTDSTHDPMVPHTLVLKPGLVVHSVYNGYWFWGRPTTSDLWHDLRNVMREVRPDWDLNAPGLRERWDSGDRAPFYGWGRPQEGQIAQLP